MERNAAQQEKKRAHDKRTVSQMIALYCAGNHGDVARTAVSHSGEPVCAACAALDAYAQERVDRCPHIATKTSCDRCPVHCYSKAQLGRIREVMRYSGPRMMGKHPVSAVRHLLGI